MPDSSEATAAIIADYLRKCERQDCRESGFCRDPECTAHKLAAALLPGPVRPTVAEFLAGQPVTYNAGRYGDVMATYRKPSDSPVLRIRKIGHRRAIKAVPMSEREATAFLLNIDNPPEE